MVTTAAAERFLATPLLNEVEEASRQAVLDVLCEQHAPAGSTLLEQGHANGRLNFLIDGTVTILRNYPEGRVETVATLGAPSVFGETSFFSPNPAIVSVRANTPVWLLMLDHPAHNRLRRENLKAAEQLALAAARVMSERFDLLDKRISDYIAQHPEGHARSNEWSNFRARLFEGSTI